MTLPACRSSVGINIVAVSGGKDSTALALRLAELNPETDYTYVCTPTGDELPEMVEHWEYLESLLGKPILKIRARLDLNGLIKEFNALPNWRQRWCTRMLKIEPIKAFYLKNPNSTVYVGLRADEEKRKGGIFGDLVQQRYPLQEWGWGLKEVLDYLEKRNIQIPKRTDCARCYEQRLGEWWSLWSEHPEIYADAEKQESETGHTFRSPQRDTWPAALKDMRAEFEKGRIPRGMKGKVCRVCSL